MDLTELRREYTFGGVAKSDLVPDPIEQFSHWLTEAKDVGVRDTSAMIAATVNAAGMPSQRTVLLKHFSQNGFVFFTNKDSSKAQEIAVNAQVSLLFPWYLLDRQVIVRGQVSIATEINAGEYFFKSAT